MTGQQDRLYTAVLHSIFLQGKTHELTKQIHTRVCADPEAPSKSFIGKGVAGEFGRTILRALMPLFTPYILAALTGLGAMIVTLWKAFTRGWFGF